MFQVNKSSSDLWNNLKLTWQSCADLPHKYSAVSVAELDGNVYAAIQDSKGGFFDPLMYDSNKNQWSMLTKLPYGFFSLVTVPNRKQLLAIGGMKGVVEISNEVFLYDEVNRKWTTPYPNMPTARFSCSSISHGSTVLVAGGIISCYPWTMTRAVEVLHIMEEGPLTKSYWSVVEQLPHVVFDPIPLIVNDKLYITVGYDKGYGTSTCNVVTASLPELLQSSNNNTSRSQVWSKLPDMPYSSYSINHYQGRLITFGGDHMVEQPDEDKPAFQSVPLIHIYNPDTRTWDCVGEIPHKHVLGMSVHIRENKLLFIGGATGTHDLNIADNIITTCSMLTMSPW